MILVGDAARAQWRWPHFDPREIADHQTGILVVDTDFMDRLEPMRVEFGRPLYVTSCYRTPEHNRAVSFTGEDGPHTTSNAIDIRIFGAEALQLVGLALKHGFTGIGISQAHLTPLAARFIHLDDLTAPAYPRPMIWSY